MFSSKKATFSFRELFPTMFGKQYKTRSLDFLFLVLLPHHCFYSLFVVLLMIWHKLLSITSWNILILVASCLWHLLKFLWTDRTEKRVLEIFASVKSFIDLTSADGLAGKILGKIYFPCILREHYLIYLTLLLLGAWITFSPLFLWPHQCYMEVPNLRV